MTLKKQVTKEKFVPQKPHTNRTTTIAIFVMALVAIILLMPRDLIMFDEGFMMTDAMRIRSGDVVHRDFYSNYGPAQYYIVASLTYLSKYTFVGERFYDAFIKASIVAVLFRILTNVCSMTTASVFTFLVAIWLVGIGAFLYPIFPCLMLVLISCYIVACIPYNRALVPSTILVVGMIAGLISLFRYDVGFFIFSSNMFAMLVLTSIMGRHKKIQRSFLIAIIYSVGAVVLVLPIAALYICVSPIKPLFDDIVGYGSVYYPSMRGLPFPGIHEIRANPTNIAVYLPFVTAGMALFELFRIQVSGAASSLTGSCMELTPQVKIFESSDDSTARILLIVFGSAATILSLKGVVRVSPIHMLLAIVPSLFVLAVLVDRWWDKGRAAAAGTIALVIIAYAPAISLIKRDFQLSMANQSRSFIGWLIVQSGISTLPKIGASVCDSAAASGIARLPPDYARIANYLARYTQPDEKIFVGLDRHDKIFANAPGLYFAAGRLPGTHWHQFDPGLQTRADIQAAIIGDLKINKVRWVVRDASLDDVNEPNGSAQSSGVTLLDHFIVENYRPVAAAGKVQIWLASTQSLPAEQSPPAVCEATPTP